MRADSKERLLKRTEKGKDSQFQRQFDSCSSVELSSEQTSSVCGFQGSLSKQNNLVRSQDELISVS